MPTMTHPLKAKATVTVVERYDVAADSKKRINLRNAKTKYFHVKALSNGCYLLEPRVLVPPQAIASHGLKIFQSYLENNTPGAGRLFWAYGPEKGDITILAIEPHPEDQKRGSYQRIKLSRLPAAKLEAQKGQQKQ